MLRITIMIKSINKKIKKAVEDKNSILLVNIKVIITMVIIKPIILPVHLKTAFC